MNSKSNGRNYDKSSTTRKFKSMWEWINFVGGTPPKEALP
jgi:hypothetical protein